ncbi:hypothetical protein ACGVWS_10895 [Enterobacteriaceae bacterium LUAb1]
MISRKILVVFFLLIINYHNYAIASYVDLPTKEASTLITEYFTGEGKTTKAEVIEKLHNLAKENPDNINVIGTYMTVLVSSADYKKAIHVLESFNERHTNVSLILSECMLKDRIGDYDSACYEKVISLKKAKGKKDSEYLLALFMMGDKNFHNEKEAYLKNHRDFKKDLDIFNNGKRNILNELYPN